MAYGQINYPQILGSNSTFPISKYGCLDTAFSNLASSDFNHLIDPLELNQRFIDVSAFLNVGDKNPDGSVALDGLYWDSITKVFPNIIVSEMNNNAKGSWPQSNKAIVKFAFRGTTHFAKVADYTKQLILDSWDGVVRAPGYYGEPVAYATYVDTTPAVAIQAMTPIQAASSKSHVGADLVLPGDVTSWRVYKVTGPYTSNPDASIGKLAPAQFGGLRYQIQDNPMANIYVINTDAFGQVAIYAGPDTPAQFVEHQDVAAAPAPTPPVESNFIYTKFDIPMELVTNKAPTTKWNLDFKTYADAQANTLVELGSPFVAYGKAQRTDLDKPVYFMEQADFGSADMTGTPESNVGINTIDLSPKPVETTPIETVEVKATAPTTAPDWQKLYKNVGRYEATKYTQLHDLVDPSRRSEIEKGQALTSAAKFLKDSTWYVLTEKAVENKSWMGIPLSILEPITDIETDDNDDSIFHEVTANLDELKPLTEKAVSVVSGVVKTQGFREWLLNVIMKFRLKKIQKQNKKA